MCVSPSQVCVCVSLSAAYKMTSWSIKDASMEIWKVATHPPDIHKRWKARLIVCLSMLVLAFVGLIIMNLHAKTYWFYSRIMAALYAILSIWLFWYLNRGQHKVTRSTIWHQLLHWIGLLFAIYLISIFVSTGVMGTTQAGLVTLTLLALTIFLAGVYTDISFILIGITLAIFAACAALIEAYLSVFMIPVILISAFIIFLIIHHEKRKAEKA